MIVTKQPHGSHVMVTRQPHDGHVILLEATRKIAVVDIEKPNLELIKV